AGISFTDGLSERTATIIGTGAGGQNTQDDNHKRLYGEGAKRLHPLTIPKLMVNAPASQVSMHRGLRGPAFALASACAPGTHALGGTVGFGMSSDAGDLTSPDEGGMVRAIEGALADAGLAPADIQYVNAHGTGTAANDQVETNALKRAFGRHAEKLAISSNKSMLGHALGAAGAL